MEGVHYRRSLDSATAGMGDEEMVNTSALAGKQLHLEVNFDTVEHDEHAAESSQPQLAQGVSSIANNCAHLPRPPNPGKRRQPRLCEANIT